MLDVEIALRQALTHEETLGRREVLLSISALGEEMLSKLSALHREQLRTVGPTPQRALGAIVDQLGGDD